MMKALTVYQPWASLTALGEKKIETRGWYTKYRGPLAIHAGKSMQYNDVMFREPFFTALEPLRYESASGTAFRLPYGEIIAICNLVDCCTITPEFVEGLSVKERVFGDYTLGRFAWMLEDTHRLKGPIPARGKQRLWNWDETEYQVCIDPFIVGDTRIWTPLSVRSGKAVAKPNEDTVMGLEVRA